MVDTIQRGIDIEVRIIHADKAKADLRDVSTATDKTADSAQKLLKDLLKMGGGLNGVGKAANDAGANLVPLKVVEDVGKWFEKATAAVNGFEAGAKKATGTVKTFSAEAAADFAKMAAELYRLGEASDYGVQLSEFVIELGKSAEWLVPIIGKARDAGYEFNDQLYQMANLVDRDAKSAIGIAADFENLDAKTSKLNETTRDLTATTKDFSKAIEQETHDISEYPALMADAGKKTEKTGSIFDFAKGKALKFFGAIGLGIYSMYTLASALRRGVRNVIDFVKGGIDLAVKAHKEWQVVIASSKKKLGELQQELGEKLLPQIGAVNVAQRELMETLGDTGAIDGAAQGIGTLALAWAGVLYAINECIKAGKKALDQAGEWAEKHGIPLDKIIRAGFAFGTAGLSEEVGPLVKGYAKLGKRSEAQAKAEAAAGDPVAAEYGRYLSGGLGPFSAEMYKRFGLDTKKGKPAAGGGRAPKRPRAEYLPSVEKGIAGIDILPPEELAAAESGLAIAEIGVRHEEEREAKRKANREKEAEIEAARIAKLKGQAEEIGQLINPTDYIIEGLKSGDMDKAIQEFAINLGETVARELISKLIMMGVMAIINAITGGGGGILQGALTAQHGMYTGEYEGPVFVHKHEVIQPLDTYAQMGKLLNRAIVGVSPGVPRGEGAKVNVMVSERAGDLVDVHRTESVFRGGEALSALEGA